MYPSGNFHKYVYNETGNTFDENAVLKAKKVVEETGCAAIGDDSGLEVRALGNRPGIYTARYAGPQATDRDNIQKLLRELSGISFDERQARFVCSLALVLPDGRCFLERGFLEGIIAFEPRGQMDSDMTRFSTCRTTRRHLLKSSDEHKNIISHRAGCCKKIKRHLVFYFRRIKLGNRSFKR